MLNKGFRFVVLVLLACSAQDALGLVAPPSTTAASTVIGYVADFIAVVFAMAGGVFAYVVLKMAAQRSGIENAGQVAMSIVAVLVIGGVLVANGVVVIPGINVSGTVV
ncbi:MAG: hypothetical protein AAGB34_03050 [Planctomycetota bacterium]